MSVPDVPTDKQDGMIEQDEDKTIEKGVVRQEEEEVEQGEGVEQEEKADDKAAEDDMIRQEEHKQQEEKAEDEVTRAKETEESTPARPISGDVGDMLQQMDNGGAAAKLARQKLMSSQKSEILTLPDVLKLLPEGSAVATPADVEGRPIPPHAVAAIIIPSGKTIPKELLEKCVKHGFFPMPPKGVRIWDIIDVADRSSMMEQQAKAEELRRRNQQVNTHMMSGAMPDGMAMKSSLDFEDYPIGLSGLRIPDASDFDVPTSVVWKDDEHTMEVNNSLTKASFIGAAKWTGIGLIAYTWCAAMGLFFWGNVYLFVAIEALVALAFYCFIRIFVSKKAAGYQCPKDYLNVPQENKVAVVTGGTSGVGAEIVKQLYRVGLEKIFVVEKSFMMALKDLSQMKKDLTAEGVDTSEWSTVIEPITCDLSDLADVNQFTKMLASKKMPIHYLVLNSSEYCDVKPKETEVDKNFRTNYLGHFLLAKQLFVPINMAGGRVVTTSNQLYALVRDLDLHETVLKVTDEWSPVYSFLTSKSLGILFTKMLAQRMSTLGVKNVKSGEMVPTKAFAACFNPGIVQDKVLKSMVYRSRRWLAPILLGMLKPISKTPKDAAQTAFKLLFAPLEHLQSGGFYDEGYIQKTCGACNVTKPEVKSNIVKLWQMSSIMVYDHSFEAAMNRMRANGETGPSTKLAEPEVGKAEQ
eukprot:GHVH01006414.1.p1 GENE.GHVH01006414.1~~GHVH01006414.1.p1  ORF type:complete len:693 (+),score=115.87 GHVH01006414.1:87-2165(+)